MISLKNVGFSYGSVKALRGVSVDIEPNSMIAIVGNNGAGKTTLLQILAGLLKPTQGSMQKPDHLRFAYLSQQTRLDHQFPMRVIDVVQMGLWPFLGHFKRLNAQHLKTLEIAITTLGLKDFQERPIDSLSGGQFQRMLFARMMVQNADVLLLDEPFVGVDQKTASSLLVQLTQWHQEGKTIIAILHDYHFIESYFPQCLLLANALVAFGETASVFNEKTLSQIMFNNP